MGRLCEAVEPDRDEQRWNLLCGEAPPAKALHSEPGSSGGPSGLQIFQPPRATWHFSQRLKLSGVSRQFQLLTPRKIQIPGLYIQPRCTGRKPAWTYLLLLRWSLGTQDNALTLLVLNPQTLKPP